MKMIIVNCFDTIEHRVDLLYKIFDEAGYNVEVLTSDYRHFEKKRRTERKKGYKLFYAKAYKKNISYSRLKSHVILSRNIFKYLKESKTPDILWVMLPPNSFANDAAKYKKEHPQVKLIFDLIDLWPESMPIGNVKKIFPFTIWKNLRDKNIGLADYIVTECNLYSERLKNVLEGMPVTTLYLARQLIVYHPKLNLPDDRVNLCYLGSINNIIDITAIKEIIKGIIKEKQVEMHIVGDGEQKNMLIETVRQIGAIVVDHGVVFDRDEKQKVFDSCHFGLNIMKKSVCVGLTMKSMDYFEFGLPIINNIPGDTWDVIEKYGCGVNVFPGFNLTYSNQMRNSARKFFEQNLSYECFAEKVLKIHELLC